MWEWETSEFTPNIYLRGTGATAEIIFAHARQVADIDYSTGEPKLNQKGNPRKKLEVIGLFVDGNAQRTQPKDTPEDETRYTVPDQGAEVALSITGLNIADFSAAHKTFANSVGHRLAPGDRLTVTRGEMVKVPGTTYKRAPWTFELSEGRSETEIQKATEVHLMHLAKDSETDAKKSAPAPTHDETPPPYYDEDVPF